jgi:hypothetical protein
VSGRLIRVFISFLLVQTYFYFSFLVSIVAEKIPALKKHYNYDRYDDSKWEQALTDYLGDDLASWAGRNSELWGNETRINGVKS